MKKIVIESLATDVPGQKIEVEVYYDLGGMNMITNEPQVRGYYLSAKPVTLKDGFKTVTAFSGTKVLLEAANRFSKKRFAEIAAAAPKRPEFRKVIDHVVAKNKIVLKGGVDVGVETPI